jgi:hypothetical protein
MKNELKADRLGFQQWRTTTARHRHGNPCADCIVRPKGLVETLDARWQVPVNGS